ncbi:MAG: hypothetical protein IRY88_05625 [Rubrobacteraceae bacterium]|nr:hypothetical protein [Rubrobacteraceae bacterium]
MPGNAERRPELSREERLRVVRAAALRPWNLVVLVVGLGIFATTLAWWMLPLTATVYTLLTFLAFRDPLLRARALGRAPELPGEGPGELSPERRAHWLPRGETRQRVEEALDAYRKVLAAIRESDEVTRELLEDAGPKLDEVANHLVEVALARERAARTLDEVGGRTEGAKEALEGLQEQIERADAEISSISERLFALRAQVVRISLEGNPLARESTRRIGSSLDEMRFRLQALEEILPAGEERQNGG